MFPHLVRILLVLGLIVLLLATAAGQVAAQVVEPVAGADLPLPRLREYCNDIHTSNFDPSAVERAEEFLELTSRRIWTYVDRGKTKSHADVYAGEDVRGDQRCLMFASRAFVPIALLDEPSQAALNRIRQLRIAIARDHRDLIAREQEFAATEQERLRREEEERRQAQQASQIRRVQMLVDTDVPVVVGGQRTVFNLGAGEIFQVAGETPTDFVVIAGAQQVAVDRRRVRELPPQPVPQVVFKPLIPDGAVVDDVPGPAPAPPPKLDCQVGSVTYPNGKTVLVVEDVFRGGLGEKIGLRVGQVVERVNDIGVGTLDEYRVASQHGDGGIKIQVFDPNLGRRLVLGLPATPVVTELGVSGHIDARGEFMIDDVARGRLAESLGLRRDCKILALNGRRIRSEDELRQTESTAGGRFTIRALIGGVPRDISYP